MATKIVAQFLILFFFAADCCGMTIAFVGGGTGVSGPLYTANGDYINETFDDLTATNNTPYNASNGWLDTDNGSGVSQLATFDGVDTVHLDSVANTNSDADRRSTFGTGQPAGNRLVVTYRIYPAELPPSISATRGLIVISDMLGGDDCGLQLSSDGAFMANSTVEIGTNINFSCSGTPVGCWQVWTLDCDKSGGTGTETCDIYLDDVQVAIGVDICTNYVSVPNGGLRVQAFTDFGGLGPVSGYVDYILSGSKFSSE